MKFSMDSTDPQNHTLNGNDALEEDKSEKLTLGRSLILACIK